VIAIPDRIILILLILAAATDRVQAQHQAPEIAQNSAPLVSTRPCPVAIIPIRQCLQQQSFRDQQLGWRTPDHRYEGLGIGAGIGAAVGVIGGFAICSQSDVTCGELVPLTALSFGAIGGFIGLLVGAQFPKESNEPAPADSLPS
jgi:hypothetical protein